MGNYVTTTQVKNYKVQGTRIDVTAYSDIEIEAEIALAEYLVEQYTGTIFYQKSAETNYFDGNGDRMLFVYPDVHYPLITATTVLEVDEQDNTLYTYTTDEFHVTGWHLETTYSSETSARRMVARSGLRWPKGMRNIKILGDWGVATTPVTITRVCTLIALERMVPGTTGTISGADALKSREKWDDYEVEYSKQDGDAVVESLGSMYLDRLIQGHMVQPSMFLTPQVHLPH